MPITECRGCGQSVSTEAKACPHCGTPHPAREYVRQQRKEKLGEAAGTAAGFGCAGLGCAASAVMSAIQLLVGLAIIGFLVRACS